MLTVHHLENSRSQRILWLLEELGVPYEIKHYKRNPKTNLAPPELKAVHPIGKAPVIEDNGRTYAETGAMIEYILDQYGEGRMRPLPGSAEYDAYRYWSFAAEGSYMPPMVFSLFLNKMESAPMPFFAKPIARKLVKAVREGYLDHTTQALFDYLEEKLGRNGWLAGEDITGADIIMSFPMEGFSARIGAGGYPNIAAAVARNQARPAYVRALERGGPYALMTGRD